MDKPGLTQPSQVEGHLILGEELAVRLSSLLGLEVTASLGVGKEAGAVLEFKTQPNGIFDPLVVLGIEQEKHGIPVYRVYIYEHFYHGYFMLTAKKASEIQDAIREAFHDALDCDFEMRFSIVSVGNYGLEEGERENSPGVFNRRAAGE